MVRSTEEQASSPLASSVRQAHLRIILPCIFLAYSQLYSAVRAPPTWRLPVGDGANLTLTCRGGISQSHSQTWEERHSSLKGKGKSSQKAWLPLACFDIDFGSARCRSGGATVSGWLRWVQHRTCRLQDTRHLQCACVRYRAVCTCLKTTSPNLPTDLWCCCCGAACQA